MLKDTVHELIQKVHSLENSEKKEEKQLPGNCYFLNEDQIVAYPRKEGNGRYPYSCDGRILWANSSGVISMQESNFNIFYNAFEGREPYLCFFMGEERGNGYFPISLLGVARQPMEKDVKRYVVFTPEAAYYFTETQTLVACVRVFMDTQKRACFSTYVENISNKALKTYTSVYFNVHMLHGNGEAQSFNWYKYAKRMPYGFKFRVIEYFSREEYVHNVAVIRMIGADNAQTTTSRYDYTGGMNESLNCSTPLQTGTFEKGKEYTEFTELPVAGTMNPFTLKSGESHVEEFIVAVGSNKEQETEALALRETNLDDAIAIATKENLHGEVKRLNICFKEMDVPFKGREQVFNSFLYNVARQVEFCTRAKNYAGAYLGVRDVFQQIEAAIAWIPDYCRTKIIEALNFIGDNGRPPRQFSYPPNATTPPAMDLRPFIDQGVWIISTVYTYLAYTDDYSILNEECGYYTFQNGRVLLCDKRDSVLEHLLAICDYLVSNIDENTHCLKALFGDWNDALDGLGMTKKAGRDYGNGVSVMASLQLYKNLWELAEICNKVHKYEEKAKTYLAVREKLKEGLITNAIAQNDRGDKKILHGWGDDKSFFVGSFEDSDGYSRDSLTVNAYWILSDLYKETPQILPFIQNAYERLDSKYGLKTFEPYFSSKNDKVGRINRLPKGTAENGATYIHATLFGIWSLFEIDESKKAWEQIVKILPFMHQSITTTPFVMPNSYAYNEERGFDGESMSDWFTGSGCVLMKALIGGAFGVKPTLDGVKIEPSRYMPCNEAEITLKIKGTPIHIHYEKQGVNRKYHVSTESVATKRGVFIPTTALLGNEISVHIFD